MQDKPILGITMGDVNGIGPEVLAKALARADAWDCCRPLALGDAAALDAARRFAPGCPPPAVVESPEAADWSGRAAPVLECGQHAPEARPGALDPEAGRCAGAWIEAAVRLALEGRIGGMVTCPISKECLQKAGYPYTGPHLAHRGHDGQPRLPHVPVYGHHAHRPHHRAPLAARRRGGGQARAHRALDSHRPRRAHAHGPRTPPHRGGGSQPARGRGGRLRPRGNRRNRAGRRRVPRRGN